MVFKNLKKAQAKSEKRLHSDAIRLIGIDERSNGVLAASCPDLEIFIKAYDDVSVSTKESYLQIAIEAAQNLVRLQPKCKISSLFLIKLLFNHTAGPTDIESFCSIEKEYERIISVLKEQEQEEEDKTTNEILNFWEYSTNLVKSYVEKRSLMAMWRFDEEKYTEAIEIAQITRDRVMDWGFTHRFLAGLYEELAFRFEDKKHTYLNSAFASANAAVSLCDEPIEYTCFHIAVMIRRGAYDIEELTSEFRNLEDIEEDGCDSYTSLIDSWTGLENPNQFRRPILEFSNKFLPDGDVQLDNTFRPFAKLGDWCDHEKAKVKGVCAKLCNQLALTEEHSTVRRFSPVDNDELRFQKQRVVRLWNGLSHDKKRSYLTASFKDFAKTLEPADREFVLEAIVFANDNKGSSKHYACYYPECAEKSVSEASYWKHIGRHMNSKDKKFLKTLPENLPQILKDEWLSSFSDGRWEPVDFNTAMKSAQTSPETFIQKDDLWPFVEDPARASLLHDLRYLLQSLNTLGFLTEGHLDSMTTYSLERLCAEPLQLAWSKCHICFCCLELTALRELVNALVDLFEVCSKISQRRDRSLVYAFENQGISLVVNNVSGLTVEDSTLIDGADFLDSLYSGPSFKDLVEWWRSLREERNIHAELLAQTLTSQYVRYTKRILESRSVHQHDILVLNETDALLNRARIAIHQLKCKIFDTAVDSYDELLWALMKPHIQGRLRQALLDCVDS